MSISINKEAENIDKLEHKIDIDLEDYYKTQIERIEKYLSKWIGYYYHQTYYNCRFWSNISTPINLSLTLLTALIAAQATSTGTLLSEHTYMTLSFTTMILTTLNSYFRPQLHVTETNDSLVRWIRLGYKLDEIVFSGNITNKSKFDLYKKLLTDMNEFTCIQSTKERNFLTDSYHYFIRWVYGPDSENWLGYGDKKEDKKEKKKEEIEIEEREEKYKKVDEERIINISNDICRSSNSSDSFKIVENPLSVANNDEISNIQLSNIGKLAQIKSKFVKN